MLQERIPTKQQRVRQEIATYHLVSSRLGRMRKLWFKTYTIKPPTSRPFLPSDEALRRLVSSIPSMRFSKSVRFPDHDIFLMYGRKENVFITAVDADTKKLRTAFLREVANAAFGKRPIPIHIYRACEVFLTKEHFVNVLWDGKYAIAYNRDSKRFDGRHMRGTQYERSFRTFEHACGTTPPFYHEAAH